MISKQSAKQVVVGLTLLLFVLGYLLVIRAGISDVKDLFGFLVASYLVVWGGYSLLSPVPREEIRIQFVLMTLALGFALFLAELPALLKLIDYRKTFSISGSLIWEQPGYKPDFELLAKPEPRYTVNMLFSRGNIGDALCLETRRGEPFESEV